MSGTNREIQLSIVTINFNNSKGLKKTLESVNQNSKVNYEVIIIDNLSNDNSLEIAKSFKNYHKRLKIISERDNGIYEAMNKGINFSEGKWVVFMNSGDCFFEFDNIYPLLIDDKVAVSYGNSISKGIESKPFNLNFLKKGIIHACHQSMFFNSNILQKVLKYNTEYRIYGDYELVNKIFLKGFKFVYKDILVSKIEPDGVSQKISFQKRFDKLKIVYRSYGFRGLLNSYIKL